MFKKYNQMKFKDASIFFHLLCIITYIFIEGSVYGAMRESFLVKNNNATSTIDLNIYIDNVLIAQTGRLLKQQTKRIYFSPGSKSV